MINKGKGAGIIVVMLIAFFSVSLITTVNASPTSAITVYNLVGNGKVDFTVDGETYTNIHTFDWVQGSMHVITTPETINKDRMEKYLASSTSYIVPTQSQSLFLGVEMYYGIYVVTNGTGSVSPSGLQWVTPWGDGIQLTATPTSPQQTFVGWEKDAEAADVEFEDASSPTTYVAVGQNCTVIADFYTQPSTQQVVIYNMGMNYKVDGAQTTQDSFVWEVGTTHTIQQLTTTVGTQVKYVPNGFQVGINYPAGDTLTYTVTSDPVLSIWFNNPTTYCGVNVVSSGSGTITPSGLQWVLEGDSLPILATPNTGYTLQRWTITDDNDRGNSIEDTNALSTNAQIYGYATITATFTQQVVSSNSIQIVNVHIPLTATQTSFAVSVNVTIRNPDLASETALIELRANSTLVFSTNVQLNAQEQQTIQCYFNASLIAVGNSTLTTTVTTTTLPDSTPQIANNVIGVTYLGDINGDFTVNFRDISAFVASYISSHQTGICQAAADYTHDSTLNFNDILLFVRNYTAWYQSK